MLSIVCGFMHVTYFSHSIQYHYRSQFSSRELLRDICDYLVIYKVYSTFTSTLYAFSANPVQITGSRTPGHSTINPHILSWTVGSRGRSAEVRRFPTAEGRDFARRGYVSLRPGAAARLVFFSINGGSIIRTSEQAPNVSRTFYSGRARGRHW